MSDLEKRAKLVQEEATRRIEQLVAELRREGWDLVALSISRLIEDGEHCACPGASMVDTDAGRMGPGLPREADVLRHLASVLDESFARLGCKEATEGYREEVYTELPTPRRGGGGA